MKNKIKIFRKLVRCASIALLSFSMAGCGADFLDTTPTNNISGSSIWTKATLAEQAVIGGFAPDSMGCLFFCDGYRQELD